MALISTQDQETIRTLFTQRLQDDVRITYYTQGESVLAVPSQECDYCADTRQLLEEVAALSDQVHLQVKDFVRDAQDARAHGITHIPALVLEGHARGAVRFFGIPAGYEFAGLLESIFDVSTGSTDLSDQTRGMLEELTQDVHIQVFVTPTCPYCPQAVRLAHKMAVESAHIIADAVEVSEFPDLAQRYHVSGVPKTVVNEAIEVVGAVPEAQFMQRLVHALEHPEPALGLGRA